MTAASWLLLPLLVLNMAIGARAVRTVRDIVPGWRRRGCTGVPRTFITGLVQVPPDALLESPLTQTPCAAWQLRLLARRGRRITGRLTIGSAGQFTIRGPSTSVDVQLRPYAMATHPAGRTFGPHPWILVANQAAENQSVVVREGDLVSPDPSLLASAHRLRLELAAKEILAAHRFTDGQGPDTRCQIDESIVPPGDEWVYEGPASPGVPRDALRLEARSFLVSTKLAPSAGFLSARWRLVLGEFSLLLAIDAFLLLCALVAWVR